MIKQVIVMRTDLNMRKGKMAAQAAHVSMMFMTKKMCYDRWSDSDIVDLNLTSVQREWLQGSFVKIVVGAADESTLNVLEQAAKDLGIEVHSCTDNGTTEFHGVPTKTCIALGPDYSEKIDAVTGALKLL